MITKLLATQVDTKTLIHLLGDNANPPLFRLGGRPALSCDQASKDKAMRPRPGDYGSCHMTVCE